MSDVSTPNTVEVNGFEITSTESAEDMLRALKPADKEVSKEPRVIKPIPDKPREAKPDAKLSKAAAKLGAAGGAAAAAKRAEAKSADAASAEVAESGGEPEPGDEAVSSEVSGERPLGKPESDPYARVRQATAQAQAAKRERDQALAELQRLRSEFQQRQPEPAPQQAQPEQGEDAPPKAEDFEDWNDYIRADARWVARQEFRAQQEQAQAEAEVRRYGEFLERSQVQFRERVASAFARENPPQIAEHILGLKTSFARQQHEPATAEHVIADALYIAPNGIELMEYLSEHGDAFDYLTQLPSPEIIQWEMRRISDLLFERPEPGRPTVAGSKAQSVSRAYPPVKTVTGSPAAADPNEISDDLPFEEYAKRRAAQEGRKARRY